MATSNDALREEVRRSFALGTWEGIERGVQRICEADRDGDVFAQVIGDIHGHFPHFTSSLNPGNVWFGGSWSAKINALLAVMNAAADADHDRLRELWAFSLEVESVTLGPLEGKLRLDALAPIVGLRRLELRAESGPEDVEVCGSIRDLGLRELSVAQLRADLELDSPTLRWLTSFNATLDELDGARLPALQRLTVMGESQIRTLKGLEHTSLRELDLGRVKARDLQLPPKLESLAVDVTDWRSWTAPAGLKHATLTGARDVLALVDADVQTLTLIRCTAESLNDLHRLTSLRSLCLDSPSFAGEAFRLRLPSSLRRLEVTGGSFARVDLGAGETLKRVSLRDARLEKVAPLAKQTGLTHLDLRRGRADDLASLTTLKHLQVLHLGRQTRYEDVPEALRDRVKPKRLRVMPKRLRELPRPKPAKGSLRVPVGRLKKLARANDYETIDQVVELAQSLGSPDVFRALLDGTSVREEIHDLDGLVSRSLPSTLPQLVPNALFDSAARFRRWRMYAVRRLMAAAPADSPTGELRRSIRRLAIVGRETKERRGDVHLGGLDAFESLEELILADCANVHGGADLTTESLRTLRVCGAWSFDLPPAREALTTIELTLAPSPEDALAAHTQLRRLRFAYPRGKRDLGFLASLGELRELELAALPLGDVDALQGCPRLESVALDHLSNPDARLFRFATKLRRLAVRWHNLNTELLRNLPHADGIEHLDLTGARLVGSLEHLRRFTKLRTLVLDETRITKDDVATLHELPLERLELRKTKLGGGRLKAKLRAITVR